MKVLTLSICLLVTSFAAVAEPINEQKYVRLKAAYLQEEIRHLQAVIDILSENDTSKAEVYEAQHKQNRRTLDELLARNDVSLKDYFEYEQANKAKVRSLLAKDKKFANEIGDLEAELSNLRTQNAGIIHIVREQD